MNRYLPALSVCLGTFLSVFASIALVGTPSVAAAGSGSTYTALSPVRILDTRTGGGQLGPNTYLNLQVAGTQWVPSTATAVVVNVTATDTTASSYLTVYPAGGTRPNVSNINWTTGQTVPNLVTVPVGSGGGITLYNAYGQADVIVDLQGYFTPNGASGFYVPLTPARIADTRPNSGEPYANHTLSSGQSLNIQVEGVGNVPTSGVSAVALNVTATNTTADGFAAVYPAGKSNPGTSTLNWSGGQTVSNRVIVPPGSNGEITIYNSQGSTNFVVDVSGYFAATSTPTGASLFYAISPTRVLDTRVTAGTLNSGASLGEQIAGIGPVAASASAVVINLTATNTTAASYFNVTPISSPPSTSDLNWTAGQTVANLDIATLGSTGDLYIYNHQGQTEAVVDVFGYFQPSTTTADTPPATCSGASMSSPSSVNSGSSFSVTVSSSCPNTVSYTYFYKTPGSSTWVYASGPGSSSSYTYSTSSWAGGTAKLLAWVSTADGVYQQVSASTTVSVNASLCSGESVSVSPNPAVVSDPIYISASASCAGGKQAYYAYFARDNSNTSSWTLIQGWTSNRSFLASTQGWNSGNYSFLVWVSTTPSGTPVLQATANDALNASGSYVVKGITYSSQIYSMNCEETSLQMALTHEGIYIDGNTASTQNAILAAEGVNSSVPGIGPNYPSANPMSNFIGPPNGGESSTYEPGAYYGAIVKAANHFGGHVLASGEGITPTQVFRYVENNHPVVVWVTFDFYHYNATWYRDSAGQQIPWAGPHEHSVLVLGVGVNSVLIDNPWPSDTFGARYAGQNVWVPMSTFESVYSTFNDMAVVLN